MYDLVAILLKYRILLGYGNIRQGKICKLCKFHHTYESLVLRKRGILMIFKIFWKREMIEVAVLLLFCNKTSHSQRASTTSVSSAFSCKTVREGDSYFSSAAISIHLHSFDNAYFKRKGLKFSDICVVNLCLMHCV